MLLIPYIIYDMMKGFVCYLQFTVFVYQLIFIPIENKCDGFITFKP
jgi:hypothetical protein